MLPYWSLFCTGGEPGTDSVMLLISSLCDYIRNTLYSVPTGLNVILRTTVYVKVLVRRNLVNAAELWNRKSGRKHTSILILLINTNFDTKSYPQDSRFALTPNRYPHPSSTIYASLFPQHPSAKPQRILHHFLGKNHLGFFQTSSINPIHLQAPVTSFTTCATCVFHR